jgi:hypothetical protein
MVTCSPAISRQLPGLHRVTNTTTSTGRHSDVNDRVPLTTMPVYASRSHSQTTDHKTDNTQPWRPVQVHRESVRGPAYQQLHGPRNRDPPKPIEQAARPRVCVDAAWCRWWEGGILGGPEGDKLGERRVWLQWMVELDTGGADRLCKSFMHQEKGSMGWNTDVVGRSTNARMAESTWVFRS